MSDQNPRIEIVPDFLFEKRGDTWLFQLAPNGALSYLSADGAIGWQNLAPAAALEGTLHRGQLADWKTGADATELTLTFRYPRLPVTETMTVRLLDNPAAMTIDRLLHNAGPTPLKLHEVRMLAVDAGGILFASHSPADLRCVHVGNLREAATPASRTQEPPLLPLSDLAHLFGDPQKDVWPALTFCNAAMNSFLLQAALPRNVFSQLWQINAHPDWRPSLPLLANYAAITRPRDRQPILLSTNQPLHPATLLYQVRTGSDLPSLYTDSLVYLDHLSGPR